MHPNSTSDPRKFDKQNFHRNLSNRRFLSLRYTSMIITALSLLVVGINILMKAPISLIIINGVLASVSLVWTIYITIRYMLIHKTYQDNTDVVESPFPGLVLKFYIITLITLQISIVTTLIVWIAINYQLVILIILIVATLFTVGVFFTVKNLLKIIKEEDRYLLILNEQLNKEQSK